MIGQQVPVEITDLNSSNKPDAFWLGHEGTFGVEVKQAGEILGSLSDVEEQLSREYPTCDSLELAISGVIVPDTGTGCRILSWYNTGDGGRLTGIRGGLPFRQSYFAYRSWIRSLEAWGITVTELPNKQALATHLVASYQWSQKPLEEHQTFRRPLRLKQKMPQHSPAVLTLMGLVDPASGRTFVGEQMATGLLQSGPSTGGWNVIDILNAPCEQLASAQLSSGRRLGKVAAQRILRAVGRSDE